MWLRKLLDSDTYWPHGAEKAEGNSKVAWTMIIVFTHPIGAALYFFVRRPQRRAEADS